jgi:hypothetical protein
VGLSPSPLALKGVNGPLDRVLDEGSARVRVVLFRLVNEGHGAASGSDVVHDPVLDLRAERLLVAVPLVRAGGVAGDCDEVDGETAEIAACAALVDAEGPAVDEHAIDPALQQRRHRPPVDGEHQDEVVGGIEPDLLTDDVGGDSPVAAVAGTIGEAEAWVEALSGEVGDDGLAGL